MVVCCSSPNTPPTLVRWNTCIKTFIYTYFLNFVNNINCADLVVFVTRVTYLHLCVWISVQRVGFLPSEGEAVSWRTLQRPVRTFDFQWTVLDVTPPPEEDHANYCELSASASSEDSYRLDDLIQHKQFKDLKISKHFRVKSVICNSE